MPELPEVETIKNSLIPTIIGQKINQVIINYNGNIRQPEPLVFQKLLEGKVFLDLQRRGKYLLFFLSGDLAMVVHLRMTGQFHYLKRKEPIKKHTHLIFCLSHKNELRYVDPRKFGTFDLIPQADLHTLKGLKDLGPEPLSSDFTSTGLKEALQNKKRPIKSLLLDQKIIAGIGNIYADEILFHAQIHPETNCGKLTHEQIQRLYQGIVQVLTLGITHRGTSIRDYVDGEQEQGGFQNFLQVYGRGGEPCSRCGAVIIKGKMMGRGTHYCSICQQ